MGVSAIGARPESEIIATVRSAIARGANFFDLAGGHAAIFPAYGKALQGLREKVYLQVHFGADYTSGEYGWTTDLKKMVGQSEPSTTLSGALRTRTPVIAGIGTRSLSKAR